MHSDNPTSNRRLWWTAGSDGDTRPWDPRPGSTLYHIHQPLVLVESGGQYREAVGGSVQTGPEAAGPEARPAVVVPAVRVDHLGDPGFLEEYGLEYPYVAGSMANGISSVRMVEAMADAGMLGFFGAGGLTVAQISDAADRLQHSLGDRPFGFNLIHSPAEPELEKKTVDLYLEKGVRLVEASAYMDLTPYLVRYRVHGLHRDPDGRVVAPNRVVAKASRAEVATRFFSPPPENILRDLVHQRLVTEDQARMAEEIPMAWDLTAEADSGGHTDNQSPLTLMPTMIALKDRLADQYGYDRPLRVGAAGGIASPVSALGAFSMGAAYIVTGSINQSAVESGTSELVRDMLAQTGQADVTMAPAGDMFELGVQVQVLKWGTMFAMRAARLYELYKHYDDLDGLPPAERRSLEKTCFRAPLEDIWDQTKAWFMDRDPSQVARAEQDPKYRMALIFRWYLGQASGWANQGDESRKIDFQIFCGPAMGAFNEWVRGSFLEAPHRRDVVTLALNLLFGAAVRYRLGLLERQGVRMPHRSADVRPLEASAIKEYLS